MGGDEYRITIRCSIWSYCNTYRVHISDHDRQIIPIWYLYHLPLSSSSSCYNGYPAIWWKNANPYLPPRSPQEILHGLYRYIIKEENIIFIHKYCRYPFKVVYNGYLNIPVSKWLYENLPTPSYDCRNDWIYSKWCLWEYLLPKHVPWLIVRVWLSIIPYYHYHQYHQ